MYNRIFKGDYLLSEVGCSVATVAFIEIALKFFEQERLPSDESSLLEDYKFKLEDIVNWVFEKGWNNRFSSIKFPNNYKNDFELIENLETMFTDDKFGIRGKTFGQLITTYSKASHGSIREMKNLFEILVGGVLLVLSRPPYNFRCYYDNTDGKPYIIIGSCANPEKWEK